MGSTRSLTQGIVSNYQFHRWAIPTCLSALGFGYILWETILTDGYAITSLQVVVGTLVLGLAGPFLAFGILTWALNGAKSWEEAERLSERQRQHLIVLNQIGESVNQSLELENVLIHAIDRVLTAMQLTFGEVRLIDNQVLWLRVARGVSARFIAAERSIPLGQCACGKCASRGELVAIENLRSTAFAGTTCACEGFSSMVSVPVRTAKRVIGVIHLASASPRAFDPQERVLLTSIGYLVGAAIEKAQLHVQVSEMNHALEVRVSDRTRELEQAKEELAEKAHLLSQVLAEERRVEEKTRTHIAHDLHDGVQQLIVGALYEMQAAREAVDRSPQQSTAHMTTAQELLRQTESEMRHAIYDLRPLTLDAHGLVPAINECVTRFERLAAVEGAVRVDGTPRRLSTEIEVAAFRILQEALNNIQMHSMARHVRINIQFNSDEFSLELCDDGIGFEPNGMIPQTRAHLGLIGMRERAESVGGSLSVESHVAEGTRVALSVPISQA